jgi:predicted acyltransferase
VTTTPSATDSPARLRLVSLDVVRGLAVAAMLAVNNPGINPCHPAQLRHPVWNGFTVADTVFPLFLFCVGVSMSLSSKTRPWAVVRRSLILFAIGVGLSALKQHQLVPVGVLQHIAVTSLLAWLVLRLPRRLQWATAAAILVACGALGVSGGFDRGHTIDGTIDRFLFGRDTAEGLLVMVCSVVNVLAGAWAGQRLHPSGTSATGRTGLARYLARMAAVTLVAGAALAFWIPVNKRLWTPSYALVGIATSAAITLAVYWLVDVRGVHRGLMWLRELGANPLVVYVTCTAAAALVPDDVRLSVVRALTGPSARPLASVLWSALWILLAWLIAHALWRRRILVKL